MAAFILTMVMSLFIGAAVWFARGSVYQFNAIQEKNELLNFGLYFAGAVPISFVIVFFGIGA